MERLNNFELKIKHKSPFLFVDRVCEIGKDFAKGFKNFSYNEYYITTTENIPFFSPVYACEGIAQLSAILLSNIHKDLKEAGGFLISIDNFKWKGTILPGDRLFLETKIIKKFSKFIRVEGKCKSENFEGDILLSFTVEKEF